MKKNNFFAILSSSLVLALGLTACGIPTITRQEAEARLTQAKEKVSAETFAAPSKASVVLQQQEKEIYKAPEEEDSVQEVNTSIAAKYDLTTLQSSVLISTTGQPDMGAWTWWADGNLYIAMLQGGKKLYMHEAIERKVAEAAFPDMADGYINAIDIITTTGIETAIESFSMAPTFTKEELATVYGDGVKLALKETIQAENETHLNYDFTVGISEAVDVETNLQVTSDIHVAFELKDLIIRSFALSEHDVLVSKEENITIDTNFTLGLTIDLETVEISLPNLKDFTDVTPPETEGGEDPAPAPAG